MAEVLQSDELIENTITTTYKTSISRQDLIEENYEAQDMILKESSAIYNDTFYLPAVRILHKIYEELNQEREQ